MNHMTKEYAVTMWTGLLDRMQADPESRIMENPVGEFREQVKAGMYDPVPDEEYEQEVENIEQTSALFCRKRWATSYSLIIRGLRALEFTDEEKQSLIRLLADASEHTDFQKGVK